MPHFAAFFALRPAGRECPFFSPRRRRVLRCRGLGVAGDAGSQTPRCSVTPIRCMRWRLSTETFVIHLVRTTTTTTTPHTIHAFLSVNPASAMKSGCSGSALATDRYLASGLSKSTGVHTRMVVSNMPEWGKVWWRLVATLRSVPVCVCFFFRFLHVFLVVCVVVLCLCWCVLCCVGGKAIRVCQEKANDLNVLKLFSNFKRA